MSEMHTTLTDEDKILLLKFSQSQVRLSVMFGLKIWLFTFLCGLGIFFFFHYTSFVIADYPLSFYTLCLVLLMFFFMGYASFHHAYKDYNYRKLKGKMTFVGEALHTGDGSDGDWAFEIDSNGKREIVIVFHVASPVLKEVAKALKTVSKGDRVYIEATGKYGTLLSVKKIEDPIS